LAQDISTPQPPQALTSMPDVHGSRPGQWALRFVARAQSPGGALGTLK